LVRAAAPEEEEKDADEDEREAESNPKAESAPPAMKTEVGPEGKTD